MLLADIETAVRQDLFDPLGSSSQRWATSDLDRAIDKAVDRYSQYYPNIVFVDLPTQPYQRTYPYPVPWNASYPVWWIERVLYPLQAYGSGFAAPGAGMGATAVAGAALGIGTYQYAVTFLTPGGETPPSPLTQVITSSGNQKVALLSIPTGPNATLIPGTATNTVIGRNLYRSQVGSTTLYLLATLQDNVTASYSDSTPDAALTGKAQPPVANTSGVMLWPPFERDFAEYSRLYPPPYRNQPTIKNISHIPPQARATQTTAKRFHLLNGVILPIPRKILPPKKCLTSRNIFHFCLLTFRFPLLLLFQV